MEKALQEARGFADHGIDEFCPFSGPTTIYKIYLPGMKKERK
jgi:hypothetical protein